MQKYYYRDLFDYAYWRDIEQKKFEEKELKDKHKLELYNTCVLNYLYLIDLIDKAHFFYWSVSSYREYGIVLPSCIEFDSTKNDYVFKGKTNFTRYDYYGWTYDNFCDALESEIQSVDSEIMSMCCYMFNIRRKRRNRVKKHLMNMFKQGSCIFCTLTFDDNNYVDVSPQTRRKYVQRFLHRFKYYICNIDYGDLNGREHYHAVVVSDKVDCKWWKYGNIDFEKVKQYKQDNQCITSYLCKLTNHAIKTSTKNYRLLYSRVK